jgi:hypothetical protein
MHVTEDDPLAYLEQLDRFLEDGEGGEVPLVALRERGLDVPEDDSTLDDQALHAKLWELLHAMAELGILIDSTNHLSDRELYRWLVLDVLTQETFLDSVGHWHISAISTGSSEEETDLYLRYYADDETRELWQRDLGVTTLPPKEQPPFDRDRLLPGGESSAEEGG